MPQDTKQIKSKKPIPTHEEIEKMLLQEFAMPHSMCPILCKELENALEAVDDAPTPQAKAHALVRLHSISAQVKANHCKCTPQ